MSATASREACGSSPASPTPDRAGKLTAMLRDLQQHQQSWRCVTPRPHRVCQRIMHSFYDILHHAPAHICSCSPSVFIVVHMHFSVNTTIERPILVRCDLGVRVRWHTRCGRGVSKRGIMNGESIPLRGVGWNPGPPTPTPRQLRKGLAHAPGHFQGFMGQP